MLNYLKSEFYRILRSRATYLFIAVCSVLLLSSNIVLALVKRSDETFTYANTAFSIANVYTSFGFVFILCIMVTGIIFNNENSNHTFKNCVSYGITRGTIYFGKLIIQIMYAIVAFLVIIGVHVASAYLLLDNSGPKELDMLFQVSLAAIPLLLFVIAVANCFYFIMEGTGGAVAATCGVILALPIISGFLGMKFELIRKFADILPWNLLSSINYDLGGHTVKLFWSTNGYQNYWIAGMLQMIVFVVLGYSFFAKKEIK
ncbi:MAG TPA: ABC transporter permease [Mobilitalea sp.]|nr:ABC transporter permease [Mobilitalea sp.]